MWSVSRFLVFLLFLLLVAGVSVSPGCGGGTPRTQKGAEGKAAQARPDDTEDDEDEDDEDDEDWEDDEDDEEEPPPAPAAKAPARPVPPPPPPRPFTISSPTIQHHGAIPARHTCDAEGISPALQWTEPPPGTKSYGLVVDDPDAPERTFVHWLLFNIPADARSIREGIPPDPVLKELQGARQGRNSYGKNGWGVPCPPPGKPHRYVFRLYALDTTIDVKPGSERHEIEQAMKGHLLGQTGMIATFGRGG